MGVVLALHAGLLALFLAPRAREPLVIGEPAIQAQIISEAPVRRDTPPPPLTLEKPHIDLITPEVVINTPPVEAPVAVPARPVAAAIIPPASQVAPAAPQAVPVTPPRFDAAYLKNPAPLYPPESRRAHEQGTVVLKVRVLEQGTVAEALVEQGSGSSRLDEAALQAVRRWRFVPARQGSQSVEAWVLVPIEFEIHR